MIRFTLGVEDLASTRFAISPLGEAVHSLRALVDPSQHTLHLPWLRNAARRIDPADRELLEALVGPNRIPPDFRGNPSRALPDFLTPRPNRFVPRFEAELDGVRGVPVAVVRRDLLAVHAPDPVPPRLAAVAAGDGRAVRRLHRSICAALERYWHAALAGSWPEMRLVLEADTTYRARQLATGGARRLFADIHPNVRWDDGVLSIAEMVSEHTVSAAGRGLLLTPSVFAPKPAPPLSPGEPPALVYPSRGIGTLWAPAATPERSSLVDLLGRRRAALLEMLEEPLPTVEMARRLRVTPGAISQHLQVLHRTGLLTRARNRRQVLYRRSELGERLCGGGDARGGS